MTDKLDAAIAEMRRVTDVSAMEGFGGRWTGHDFCHEQPAHDPDPIDDAIAEILNAVLSGRLSRAALAAAPHPAPTDRDVLVEMIREAVDVETPYIKLYRIADALLARGLRLPSQDDALQQLADLGQQADRAPETMAWAVLGEDGKMVAINYDRMTAQHLCNPGERVVRVAIRVVEGGDDASD